jgi:hypothetical protein
MGIIFDILKLLFNKDPEREQKEKVDQADHHNKILISPATNDHGVIYKCRITNKTCKTSTPCDKCLRGKY